MDKYKKIKIIIVAGIRSQYIKVAAFQTMLQKLGLGISMQFDIVYVDAGQHYDFILSEGFQKELDVKFDYVLKYDTKNSIDMIGEMFSKLSRLVEKISENQKADYLIVFGDANTTMVGAIVAAKKGIRLIHVEAGLRLGLLNSPEESNRVIADHLASLRFISSKGDEKNLIREGLSQNSFFTGDIIYDLCIHLRSQVQGEQFEYLIDNETKVYNKKNFILTSLHREENSTGVEILKNFFGSFAHTNYNVIFVAHPRIKRMLNDIVFDKDKITVVDYISYKNLSVALTYAKYLMTDSGAFQREAYYYQKRCLVRQDKAFWQDLIDSNINATIGSDIHSMVKGIKWIEQKTTEKDYPTIDCFCDGHAVEKILQKIVEDYNKVRG